MEPLKFIGAFVLGVIAILVMLFIYFIKAVKGGGRFHKQWRKFRK